MPMNPGDIAGASGASQRALNYFIANKVAAGLVRLPTDDLSPQSQSAISALAYCIIKAVVDEMVANGLITIVIPNNASGSGLQTSENVGDPTTFPAMPVTLTGVIS